MSDYGGQHQAIRAANLPYAYGKPCTRCGQPMLPGQDLDLDHFDDRGGYRGFAHARCNRSAGGKLGRARQLARARERRAPMITTCTLGIQISEDRTKTSIAAAGRLDGDLIAVELAAYLDGVTSAVAEVLNLRAARTLLAVVVDPRSPAATLIRPLTEAGVTVTEPSTSDVVVANGTFVDAVAGHRLRIASHPALDAAARHGTQRPVGGARAWERRGAPVDIGPIDAATLATWALESAPQPPAFFAAWR